MFNNMLHQFLNSPEMEAQIQSQVEKVCLCQTDHQTAPLTSTPCGFIHAHICERERKGVCSLVPSMQFFSQKTILPSPWTERQPRKHVTFSPHPPQTACMFHRTSELQHVHTYIYHTVQHLQLFTRTCTSQLCMAVSGVCVCVRACVCACTCVRACVCACACTCVCVHVCVFVCVYTKF